MSHAIFVAGYPGDLGGASTELYHTCRLWRRHGCEVTLVPNWVPDPRWLAHMDALGCTTLRATLETVHLPPGAIVVSFCNERFLAAAPRFRRADCRLVWAGCMNWLLPAERLHYRRHGPFDRHVFQSRYQRDTLLPELRQYGLEEAETRLIRGPLDPACFPYQPRRRTPGEPLTIGRLSRAAPDKFHRDTWAVYGQVPDPRRARVMGWNARVEAELGRPPGWAECLPERAEPVRQFLGSLHCLVPLSGTAVENWPRAGLEAMAAGVPIVAERRGGWAELIDHGRTGYLADSPQETAGYVARLAADEPHRLEMAERARAALESEVAPAEAIWQQWREVFEELGGE